MPSLHHTSLFRPIPPTRGQRKRIAVPDLIHLPKENDLIYGLGGQRADYMECEYFEGGRDGGAFPMTIDLYPVLLGDREEGYDCLEPQLFEDLLEFINAHPKPNYRVMGNPYDGVNSRRKCKAGLDWATQKGSPMMVHFVLDGLDMDAVIHKRSCEDREVDGEKPKQRSVTGAELRWLYRNWVNPQIRSHVLFWQKDAAGEAHLVPAPWDDPAHAAAWDNYFPQSGVRL